MRVLLIVAVAALAAAPASAESCYSGLQAACASEESFPESYKVQCNATYGAMRNSSVASRLQQYSMLNIYKSFEFLLTATHFENVANNRKGFAKLFTRLSDSAWDNAIDLVKHLAKRGGEMAFSLPETELEAGMLEANEVASLGRAVDTQKLLAKRAFALHDLVVRRSEKDHDPEIMSYIQNHLVHKHSALVRELAGHTSDLARFYNSADKSLALFLFDEYLQKL